VKIHRRAAGDFLVEGLGVRENTELDLNPPLFLALTLFDVTRERPFAFAVTEIVLF